MAKRFPNKRSDSKRTPEARRESIERKAARKFNKDNGRKY